MNVNQKQPRLIRRASLAISVHEENALRWKARELGLVNGRGRVMGALVLRDHSLKAVVAEYDKRPQ